MARYVTRKRNGRFAVSFPPHVMALVTNLAGQLEGLLDDDRPELRRLFPTAYPDDPERDAGFQILARSELNDQRRGHVDRLQATADDDTLTEDDLTSWMLVVNDLRLVLGTALDVSEDDIEIDDDDPRAGGFETYHLLGAVLDEIVRALEGSLGR